jgi:hypothetical protein
VNNQIKIAHVMTNDSNRQTLKRRNHRKDQNADICQTAKHDNETRKSKLIFDFAG